MFSKLPHHISFVFSYLALSTSQNNHLFCPLIEIIEPESPKSAWAVIFYSHSFTSFTTDQSPNGDSTNGDNSSGSNNSNCKYCTCCYCEFFGNGGPPQAPTSKNYPEIRDRLRRKLNTNKAKSCQNEIGEQLLNLFACKILIRNSELIISCW